MDRDFTITLIGKGGKFSTLINKELDFATHPYEVCIQEMVFTPGSWGNVRSKANWFIVYDKKVKRSKTLYVSPRQYHSASDLLYEINSALAVEYTATCDMFYYYDRKMPNSEIVFPQPEGKSDLFFATQTLYKRRFRKRAHVDKTPIKETLGMTDRPEIIEYGGGKDMTLVIQFCQELAILLGVVMSLNLPVPAIVPGWSVVVKDVNLLRNNLMMMWIYGDFIVTTMIGSTRDQLLKIVPIVDDTKSILHSVFYMQDFIAVQRRKIQCFKIWIQEGPASTSVLPIDEEVILVLYFRPIE
jgi:hypothetical protein